MATPCRAYSMFHGNVSVEAQRRRILESLLLQASDIVWQLGLSGHPRDYMRLLESAGLVEHGKEIFVKFLNTKKDPGEKASTCLQRFQTLLNTAVKRGGVRPSQSLRLTASYRPGDDRKCV